VLICQAFQKFVENFTFGISGLTGILKVEFVVIWKSLGGSFSFMPTQSASRKGKKSSLSSTSIGIILLVVLALIAIVIIYIQQTQNRKDFTFIDGEKAVIVLLRTEEHGRYTMEYSGEEPVQIKNLQVMLVGQILHVDVNQVVLRTANQEVTLVDNNVPADQPFQMLPGETVEVDVTFNGATLGFNYLYGFRISFDQSGVIQTVDAIDPDAPDKYNYLINVE
jgi:hypothetical protein